MRAAVYFLYAADANRDTSIADLNHMLADGTPQTTIAAHFPLNDIVATHAMVEAAQHIGNVVVAIA